MSTDCIPAAIVLVNGIVFYTMQMMHCRWTHRMMMLDIMCNVVLIGIINKKTPYQPITMLLSLSSTICFIVNCNVFKMNRPVLCAIFHVMLTQWPLAFALSMWRHNR